MELFFGLIGGFAGKYALVILTLAAVSVLVLVFFRVCGTLQRYVLREIFSTFLVALAALMIITFLGFCLKLLSAGINIIHLPTIIPFVILFSLPFAIPAALLTAVVMTCGRMSSDNEITAIRSSGVHLYLVITPIILCGALMSIFALALNGWALPAAHLQIDQLREKAISSLLSSYARSAENSLEIPGSGYTIYWSSLDSDTDTYHNMVIVESEGTTMTRYVVAEEGRIETDSKTGAFLVKLANCHIGQLAYRKSTQSRDNKTLDSLKTGELQSLDYAIPMNSRYEERIREFENMPMERLFSERRKRNAAVTSNGGPMEHPNKALKRHERDYQRISQKKKRQSAIVKAAKESKSKAQARFRIAQNQTRELKETLASLGKDMEFLASQLRAHDADRRAFARELEKSMKDLEKLEKRRESSDDEGTGPASLDKEVAALKEKIEKLEQDKGRAEKRYEESRARFGKCTTKMRAAEKALRKNERIQTRSLKEVKQAEETIKKHKSSAEEFKEKRERVWKKVERAKAQVAEREITIEIQKRLAMSLAALAFVLVGAPLGILAKHGNVLIGFGISFILAYFLYYPLFMTGELLASEFYLHPALSMWMGNAIFGIMGIGLLRVIFKR